MIVFDYNISSYADFLQQLATRLGTEAVNNQLQIPAAFGSGYFQYIDLGNGLEAVKYELTVTETFVLKRQKNNLEYYSLIFDESEKKGGFEVTIGTDTSRTETDRKAALYLTSFLHEQEFILHKNIPIKGVRIILTEPWMQQYLQLSQNENVLEKYLNLKSVGTWIKPVGPELQELLHEIFESSNLPLLFYQTKFLRIIERFFHWLYNEMQGLNNTVGINRHDIEAAQKVEHILTADVTKIPPTIKEMAREVAMSESKLKKIFKGVYGLPPYEYFQQQRMQKARIMLLSGDYSIKDIGYTLGYANLSNFTLAFKKVFNTLPSQVLRSGR